MTLIQKLSIFLCACIDVLSYDSIKQDKHNIYPVLLANFVSW